jgi:hypothetical protein
MLISKLSRDRGGAKGKKDAAALLLPEASTCDKHLYLPEYNSIDEVSERVDV